MRDWVRKICQRSEKYVGKIELIGRGVLLKLYSAGSVDKGKKWMGVDNFLLLQKIFTSSLLSLPPCSRRRVLCSHISPPRSCRHKRRNHAGTTHHHAASLRCFPYLSSKRKNMQFQLTAITGRCHDNDTLIALSTWLQKHHHSPVDRE